MDVFAELIEEWEARMDEVFSMGSGYARREEIVACIEDLKSALRVREAELILERETKSGGG